MAETLVSRQEHAKAGCLRAIEQFTVDQGAPAQFESGFHLMLRKKLAQRHGGALIEQHPHSCHLGLVETAGCVIKHCAYLLFGDAREPLQELLDLSAVFQVLEQGRHRNTRTAKHPRAAHPLGFSLNRLAC